MVLDGAEVSKHSSREDCWVIVHVRMRLDWELVHRTELN